MNDDLFKKTITIQKFEAKTTSTGKELFKITDQDNDVYSVWIKKADGTTSAAGDWIQRNVVGIQGKTVGVAYKESQRPYDFVGKDGVQRSGTTTDRTVAFFEASLYDTPQQTTATTPSFEAGGVKVLNDRIKRLEAKVERLEGMLVPQVSPAHTDETPPPSAYENDLDITDIVF